METFQPEVWVGEHLIREKHQCTGCHSLDGSNKIAPSFKGIWARTEKGETVFDDGSTLADHLGPGKQFPTVEAYLEAKIRTPDINTIRGYRNVQPDYTDLPDEHIAHILAYLKTL